MMINSEKDFLTINNSNLLKNLASELHCAKSSLVALHVNKMMLTI